MLLVAVWMLVVSDSQRQFTNSLPSPARPHFAGKHLHCFIGYISWSFSVLTGVFIQAFGHIFLTPYWTSLSAHCCAISIVNCFMTAGVLYPKITVCYDSIKISCGNSPVREYMVIFIIVCGLIFSIRCSMLKARLVSLGQATSWLLPREPIARSPAIDVSLDLI